MIHMPYGGGAQFDEHELVAYIHASGRDYMIIGGANCAFKDHKKPHSLDFWLRSKTKCSDTRQTCKALMDDLVATGLFAEGSRLKCPDIEHSFCKGIRLVTGG